MITMNIVSKVETIYVYMNSYNHILSGNITKYKLPECKLQINLYIDSKNIWIDDNRNNEYSFKHILCMLYDTKVKYRLHIMNYHTTNSVELRNLLILPQSIFPRIVYNGPEYSINIEEKNIII